MEFGLFFEQVHRLPTTTYTLVLFMSLVGALLVNYMFEANLYVTFSSIAFLFVFGLIANAALITNGIMLSHDKATNIVLSTCAGFIVGALVFVCLVRIWFASQQESSAR